MGLTGSIIVYVMIWWIVFFSILPVGIQSNKEVLKKDWRDLIQALQKTQIYLKIFNNNYNYINTIYCDILFSKQ